jgi:hypothetical protein
MKLDNIEIGFVYRAIDEVQILNKIENYIDSTLSKQNGETILRFVIKKLDGKFTWTILGENDTPTFTKDNRGNQLTFKSLKQTKIDLTNYFKMNLI